MFRHDRRAELAAGLNDLASLRESLAARGEAVTDLVSGSAPPSQFPQEILRTALESACSRAAVYVPDPLGRLEARDAIASWYARAGFPADPDRILITPGTSVSYLYAFAVLCEPGDEVLVPRPSYPLFEELARIPSVRLVSYSLREANGWRIDLEQLESLVSKRTRGVVLISPHNPTGAVASAAEIREVARIARDHDLAVIADEVFSELLFEHDVLPRIGREEEAPLVLTLNGFSKMFALPGWKIGWIAVAGEEGRARDAMWMLSHVSDAFLAVNDLAQCAALRIFEEAAEFPRRLRERARRGRDLALAHLVIPDVTEIVPPAGGVFLTVRLCAPGLDEREVSLSLLRHDRVAVHPGRFYDLPPDHLVLSYSAPEEALRPALERISKRLRAMSAGAPSPNDP